MSEKKMSLYGKFELTPEERAGLWKNVLWRTDRISHRHLSAVGDGSQNWPGERVWSRHEIDEAIAARRNSFLGPRLRPTEADVATNYERFLDSKTPYTSYDAKMHRDDRKSVRRIGCAVHEEETMRPVPLLTSSHYGHRLHTELEPFNRMHVRIARVDKGFRYSRGTGIPPIDPIWMQFGCRESSS